jgi:hypothetical protein
MASSMGGDSERLEGPQLAAIERQLYALVRQQAKRRIPIELPRPDFWLAVSQLLQHVEMELAEVGRTEGWSVRAQTLSRRQANLRKTIADLTQHRLNAFMNHAGASELASTPFGDTNPEVSAMLKAIDWTRHDPAERAFHAGVSELIDQYKQNVSWKSLQQGVVSASVGIATTPAGQGQLDSFVSDGNLTEATPPPMQEESLDDGDWGEEEEMDEEERVMAIEGFPEMMEKANEQIAESESQTEETTPTPASDAEGENAAAGSADSDSADGTDDSSDEADQTGDGMLRIMILKDIEEPLIDAAGEEIELLEGDIHNCEKAFAESLIEAGIAEAAPL